MTDPDRDKAGGSVVWAIKRSLLDYVRAHGVLSCAPPSMWTGEAFAFPIMGFDADDSGQALRLTCAGEVFLSAHMGALRIPLDSLLIEIVGESGRATFTTPTFGRLHFADLRQTASPGRYSATLTDAAAVVFGGFYGVGTPLDDLRVELAPRLVGAKKEGHGSWLDAWTEKSPS